ncbi:MAG: hypothetical protein BWY67_01312 [Bacteroidetes bacterium ADurb.Bin397]|nr:MAG: hypothetical protein BWY67_01312 [Bacteroidetes bacterium ADurb.Bin397]
MLPAPAICGLITIFVPEEYNFINMGSFILAPVISISKLKSWAFTVNTIKEQIKLNRVVRSVFIIICILT